MICLRKHWLILAMSSCDKFLFLFIHTFWLYVHTFVYTYTYFKYTWILLLACLLAANLVRVACLQSEKYIFSRILIQVLNVAILCLEDKWNTSAIGTNNIWDTYFSAKKRSFHISGSSLSLLLNTRLEGGRFSNRIFDEATHCLEKLKSWKRFCWLLTYDASINIHFMVEIQKLYYGHWISTIGFVDIKVLT